MVTRSNQHTAQRRPSPTVGLCVAGLLVCGCTQSAEVLTKRVRAEQHPAAPQVVDAGAAEPDAGSADETSAAGTEHDPADTSGVTSSSNAPDAASTADETDEPRTEVLPAPPLAVGAGFATTCVVINDERSSVLLCFGQEAIDPIGLSEEDQASQTHFVAVTGGEHHMCTLTSFGDVYCWGDNERGQLGSPELERTQKPKRAWLPEPVTQLASGANHMCALTVAGQLYCWGDNNDSQLGLDETSSDDDWRETREPTLVDEGPWISVAAGTAHTCGVKSDGSLSCWGRNNELQVGNTGETQVRTPRLVNTEHSWRQVAVGQSHSCALRTDGSLWCWGSNASEDAGYPIGEQAMWQLSDPTPIGDGRWAALTSHWSHNCAITDSRELWCWGRNDAGQLGTGDTELRRTATLVASGATQAALGLAHSCVVIEDNDVRCTGSNEHGQLGLPNESDQTTFTSLREEWELFLDLQYER